MHTIVWRWYTLLRQRPQSFCFWMWDVAPSTKWRGVHWRNNSTPIFHQYFFANLHIMFESGCHCYSVPLKCLWCKNIFPQQSQAGDDCVKYERVRERERERHTHTHTQSMYVQLPSAIFHHHALLKQLTQLVRNLL
jgi:hypothetical protein